MLMALIKSISGIRGTVYSNNNQISLSPKEIVKYSHLFGLWIKLNSSNKEITIAIGRDARFSGQYIIDIISGTLQMMGISILSLDLTTTPSVQLAIIHEHCDGGIMISASHNPIEWNGLKLLNNHGEFLTQDQINSLFSINDDGFSLSKSHLFNRKIDINYLNNHIESVLKLKDVDVDKVRASKLKVVVDGINSSGGIYVPFLLKKFGVEVVELNCDPTGNFAHSPEPIPKNLERLSNEVVRVKANLGIAVDPDVDRLVLICEDGSFFGEEYTIVAIVKYILSKYPNSTVITNLSTTKAVEDVVVSHNGNFYTSEVGEINVVELMKKKQARIGGEGSGGVIFPESHYGRDALVGIGLFLSYLCANGGSVKYLRSTLPNYFMFKDQCQIPVNFDFNKFLTKYFNQEKHQNIKYDLRDGLKIQYQCGDWIHIRKSNTEPIIRIITESSVKKRSLEIKNNFLNELKAQLNAT